MAQPQYGADHVRRRKAWQHQLETTGPVICGHEGCGRLVYANPALNYDGATWQLGHGVAHHHGGNGQDSWPEHRKCNEGDGHRIATTKPLKTYEW